MKAITLTQPWSSLVAIGAKRIETRSWSTNYRGPIAIHAAKRMPKDARMFAYADRAGRVLNEAGILLGGDCAELPRGAIVALAKLVDVRETQSVVALIANLRAWCQRCHLTYDAAFHARNAAATRTRKLREAGQQALPEAHG